MHKKSMKLSKIVIVSVFIYFCSLFANPNWYEHKTFILNGKNENLSFPLSKEIENIARAYHIELNLSPLFDTKIISNPELVRKEFEKIGGKEIDIFTEDNIRLSCSYFDRGKDKVIVVSGGLTNVKEQMAPFSHMFLDYDIFIPNLRGKEWQKTNFFQPETWKLNPLQYFLQINSDTKLGQQEEKDIFAAVDFLHSQNRYKEIIGLGLCYGAFIKAKAQGIREEEQKPLFDKLILDGCWLSVEKFWEKLRADPMLALQPQRGGSSNFVKSMFRNKLFITGLETLISSVLNITHDETLNLSLIPYLQKIQKPPVIFFYSKNDLTIYRDEFETIWQNLATPNKLAVITSNEHVWNHLKQKELYKMICELFIDLDSIDDIVFHLQNPNLLDSYLHKRLQKKAKTISDENIFRPWKKK